MAHAVALYRLIDMVGCSLLVEFRRVDPYDCNLLGITALELAKGRNDMQAVDAAI